MHLSLEWLSALVDLHNLDPEEIADRLTIATAEVEGIEPIQLALSGVVAEVIEQAHGFRFYDGRETIAVDAALDLVAGERIVLAADGTPAPAPVGGEDLWRVGPDVAVGQDPAQLISPSDTLIELDNKSVTHRPDLWGHYGFARELAAIFGRELVELELSSNTERAGLPVLPIEIRSPDCEYYGALSVACGAGAATPLVVQRRLAAIGQRSRNLAVDLSNYVMFELGQPNHAFDATGIDAIQVAPAADPLTAIGVDRVERQVEPGDLLIWSGPRPLGLAGIIGFSDSGVNRSTTRIIIESANFAAARVRRTQIRLALRTDAGQRFEKSQPWPMAPVAAARLLKLLEDADPATTVETAYGAETALDPTPRLITVDATYFERAAGIAIAPERAKAILRSLRFEVSDQDGDGTLQVTVPPFRSHRDIAAPHDLLEEVARIVGYSNIEPRLPLAPTRPAPLAPSLRREREVRSALAVGHRFSEIQTYSWFDRRWLRRLDFVAERPLTLANPSSPDLAQMRTTLLPNILAAARLNREHPGVGRIFEIGRVYEFGAEPGKSRERAMVGGVTWARRRNLPERALLLELRSAVEDVLGIVRPSEPVRWDPVDSGLPWEAAGTAARMSAGSEILGSIAVAPASVVQAIGPGLAVASFELDLDALGRVSPGVVEFKTPPAYPGSWFDLTVMWPEASGYARLSDVLTSSDPLCVGREFLYVFGDPRRDERLSYTFRFRVQAPDRTLSADEVAGVRSELVSAAEAAGATFSGETSSR